VARLFSAIVPPPDVLDHLAAHVGALATDATLRWTSRDRWHVTFGFFGDDDDPDRRARWLRRRVTGRPAPALRLAGGGTFPGVLWAGVTTDDEHRLARLAQAAGAGRYDRHRPYRPHLTLARWRSGQPDRDALIDLFAGYTGPWFTPTEVLLMRSELGAGEPAYTTVESLPLAPRDRATTVDER
jgi:RNA 2',3'-cyclic 3'-phosphodiesterase